MTESQAGYEPSVVRMPAQHTQPQTGTHEPAREQFGSQIFRDRIFCKKDRNFENQSSELFSGEW